MFFSCAGVNNFKTPEKLPAIKVGDKIKAFSIATYFIEQKHYDIEEFNYGTGVIRTNWIQWNINRTMRLRSKLVFALTPEDNLDVEFTDTQIHKAKYFPKEKIFRHYWLDAGAFYTEYIPVLNRTISYINSLRVNPKSLKKCTDHFLGKFQYNYVVLKTLRGIEKTKFIQQYYTNRNYQWELPLVDFQYNKNYKYKKKYLAHFRYSIKGDNEFDKLFSNTINLNLYTDNDSLTNYTMKELVNYTGVLVNADTSFASENFNFDFFTKDSK